jgi:hypothetical protein
MKIQGIEFSLGNNWGICSVLFQVGIEKNKEKKQANVVGLDLEAKQQCKWDEIKMKIGIDPTLDQGKVDQLWQLLKQFLDVFT